MPRQTWKGVISFGMVNIPVHLAPATQDRGVSFRTLHKLCKAAERRAG